MDKPVPQVYEPFLSQKQTSFRRLWFGASAFETRRTSLTVSTIDVIERVGPNQDPQIPSITAAWALRRYSVLYILKTSAVRPCLMIVSSGAVEHASELPEALEEGLHANTGELSPIVGSGVFSSSQLWVRCTMGQACVSLTNVRILDQLPPSLNANAIVYSKDTVLTWIPVMAHKQTHLDQGISHSSADETSA